MKKVFISLFILLLISGGFIFYYLHLDRNNEVIETVQDIVENVSDIETKDMEEIDNEPITENTENNNDVVKDNSTSNSSTNKRNMESNIVSDSNVIKENKTTNNVPKQESVKTETPVQVQQSEPVPEKREQTAWESLGISEYDYYHKPMWTWARVDYKIEDYGNYDSTHQACIDAGNQLEDIISFSCTNINSYSGAYLGDMLRIKN